jgi:DMSO/TMAO reductase YedYZ heme-binding membrane subunit
MLGLILIYLIVYCLSLYTLYPNIQPQLLIIKATGSLAILMLHFILILGPLTRLNKKFLPLLYNRRHLGVTMFFITFCHALMSLLYYHGFGVIGVFESLFSSNNNYSSFKDFPFMIPGFFALLILFFMALTSHDFWLEKLSPKTWKYLHMLVYLVYGLVIIHVFTGALQREVNVGMNIFYYLAVGLVVGLHLYSALSDFRLIKQRSRLRKDGFIRIGTTDDIPSDRAKVVNYKNQSIAVFKYENKLSAVYNFCKHQGGPLGEGKILDGCITCPWHGYQYLPHNGQAPPPFNEKIATYDLKLIENQIFLNPIPHEEGTEVEPLLIKPINTEDNTEFFIGWSNDIPISISLFLKKSVITIGAVVVILALGLSNFSHELKDSKFKFGDLQVYEGILYKDPVPRLIIGNKDHLLVDFGKFSALKSIHEYEQKNQIDLDGTQVKVEGTAVTYDGRGLIELSYQVESILSHEDSSVLSNNAKTDLGFISLTGEVLDAKCFFGVMNPGEGPVHQFCASLCIQGGIPAIIFDNSKSEYYILKGPQGSDINKKLAPLAGEILKVSGNSYSINNWRYVDIDGNINRLSYKNIFGDKAESFCSLSDTKYLQQKIELPLKQ